MGIIQAIGKGFAESPKVLKVALIFFIFNFAIGLIMLPFTGPENVGSPRAAMVALVVSVFSVLIFIFLQGGALGLIKDLLKTGSVSMNQYLGYAKKYYLKILGLFVAIIAIALVLILVVALISAALIAMADTTIMRSLIAAIITIVSIVGAVLLLYPIYAIVAEDLGALQALKKGVSSSLGNFWKTLGLLIVLFLATFGIAFIIGMLIALLTGALPANIGQVITLFVNSVLQSYLSLVMMIALMAYYLDLIAKAPAGQTPVGPTTEKVT